MKMIKTTIITLSLLMLLNPARSAEQGAPKEAIKNWQDARFGMFIHWGPVSLTGCEIGWSRGQQTPVEEYDNLYKKFNPVKFDADEWVAVAKAAGMKYIVLTTKHHDGFCLWDTKQTDYNIMNTPFGRDVVKELTAACKKGGIGFGTYYSTCDWYHPDFPLTSPGGRTVRETSDLDRYTEYLKAQTRELLTNYGPLFTLWYDVPQKFNAERGQGVIDMARAIQPDIVINNRTGARGDYDTPEQKIGGFQIDRPWETCMTICRQWAWKPNDNMKSLEQCLHTLVRTSGGDGNLLFNVGPMPSGKIEARQIDRLKEMGAWLAQNGESIYGTRGGPWKPSKQMVSTRKGNKIYIHLLKKKDGAVALPALPVAIKSARLLNGAPLSTETKEGILSIKIPDSIWAPIDTIIELTLHGSAMDLSPLSSTRPSIPIAKATASATYGNDPQYDAARAIDNQPGTRWATPAGTRTCWIQLDFPTESTIDSIEIDEAYAHPKSRILKFELQKKDGGDWIVFHRGTGLGEHFQTDFPPVTTKAIRLNILDSSEGPTLTEIRFPAQKKP